MLLSWVDPCTYFGNSSWSSSCDQGVWAWLWVFKVGWCSYSGLCLIKAPAVSRFLCAGGCNATQMERKSMHGAGLHFSLQQHVTIWVEPIYCHLRSTRFHQHLRVSYMWHFLGDDRICLRRLMLAQTIVGIILWSSRGGFIAHSPLKMFTTE